MLENVENTNTKVGDTETIDEEENFNSVEADGFICTIFTSISLNEANNQIEINDEEAKIAIILRKKQGSNWGGNDVVGK